MLEHYALWFISILLCIVEIVLAIATKMSVAGSIIALILGYASYIVGVFALRSEKEFVFPEHRRSLVAPFLGILSSVGFCFAVLNETIGETYAGIGVLLYLALIVFSTVAVWKHSKRILQWIMRCFPREDIMITPPSFTQELVPGGGWRCTCGRPHAAYVSSCVCGISKNEVPKQNQ